MEKTGNLIFTQVIGFPIIDIYRGSGFVFVMWVNASVNPLYKHLSA